MKNMLILTDFSEASFRAAAYGCELAGTLGIKNIILYHAFETGMAYTDLAGAPAIGIDYQKVYLESKESLAMLQDRLKTWVDHSVSISLIAEDTITTGIPGSINQLKSQQGVDLVVMGVSGKSGLEMFIMGSVTKELLKKGEWPILIVPENTLLGKGINNIVLTSDLKDLETLPLTMLYSFLNALPGKLQVVNVEPEEKENFSPKMEIAIKDLHRLLKQYNPLFHYLSGNNIVEAINLFAAEEQASLVIAVHQKHGYLSGLFHKSITKKLAYSSTIPLLALPAYK